MGRTDYLKQRGRTYYVRVQIPPALWSAAGGKREYVRTLKTRDFSEAERRKHIHVAEFKRRIAQLEAHGEDPDAELFEKALSFKEAIQRNRGQKIYPYDDPEFAEDMGDFWLSEALDQAKTVLEEQGDEKAQRFMRVVRGEATFIRDVYLPWLEETRPKPKQRDAHSKVIRGYMEWAGQGITIEETDRKKAGAYISHLMLACKLAPKTVERYRSSLATLWTWLEEKGITPTDLSNPWAKHRSIRPTVQTKRKPLSDEQLVSLLSGTYDTPTYRQVLADLLRLALVTGCRLEELCALKRDDVLTRKDGYWFVITEGKTEAAAREVPVHSAVDHVVTRRRRSKGEYFFGEITPGAYGRRSHHVSKAYRRYREMIGVGERGYDLHALRKTFTEMMEGAGVPVHTIQLLIGHSRRATMGVTAIYSQGERVDLRKAINRLKYCSEVMRLIRHTVTRVDKVRSPIARAVRSP
jgi:integrase